MSHDPVQHHSCGCGGWGPARGHANINPAIQWMETSMAWLAAKPANNWLQLSLLEGGISLALHQMCHAAFSSKASSISLIDVLPCLL